MTELQQTLERMQANRELNIEKISLRKLAKDFDRLKAALETVLARHQEHAGGTPTGDFATWCPTCGEYWPCTQYQDIYLDLGPHDA